MAISTFDPAAWLHALVEVGGGYALASGRRLWLVVQDVPDADLTLVMAQVAGQPERIEALRVEIERRQSGEVQP